MSGMQIPSLIAVGNK